MGLEQRQDECMNIISIFMQTNPLFYDLTFSWMTASVP